jgi:hypothetical protein
MNICIKKIKEHKIMKFKYLTILLFSILVLGCKSTSNDSDRELESNKYEILAAKEKLKLNIYIKEVAEKALEIQQVRTQIENAANIEKLDADQVRESLWQNSYVPVGMERIITFKWEGPPENVLNALADTVDYDIEYYGKKYPVKPTIVIQPVEMNVKRIIDEVERQSFNRGYIKNIQILEDIKLINVHYQEH